jgi:hypothetical protein
VHQFESHGLSVIAEKIMAEKAPGLGTLVVYDD